MTAVVDPRLFGAPLPKSAMNGTWIGARPSVRRSGSTSLSVDANDGIVLGGRVIPGRDSVVVTGLSLSASTTYYVYAYSLNGAMLYQGDSTVAPDDAHTFKTGDQRYRYIGTYVTDSGSHIVPFVSDEHTVIGADAIPQWLGDPPSFRWKSATTVTVGAHVGFMSFGAMSVEIDETDVSISPAASTQYYCYAYLSQNTVIAYELVTDAPAHQMKTGDPTRRLVGMCMSDAGSNLVPFYDANQEVQEQFIGQWCGNAPTLRYKDTTTVTVGAHAGLRSESTRGKVTGETDVTVSGGSSQQWQYIYAHVSAANGTVGYEASTTGPDSATGYATMMGDTTRRYVGSVPTDTSSHVQQFRMVRGRYLYNWSAIDSTHGLVFAGATAGFGSPTAVPLAHFVPPHVRSVYLYANFLQNTNGDAATICAHGDTSGMVGLNGVSNANSVSAWFDVACDSAQKIDCATTNASAGENLNVIVVGFTEP